MAKQTVEALSEDNGSVDLLFAGAAINSKMAELLINGKLKEVQALFLKNKYGDPYVLTSAQSEALAKAAGAPALQEFAEIYLNLTSRPSEGK